VSESFADHFDGYAGFDQKGGVGVPKVVEPYSRYTRSGADPFEGLGGRVGVDRGAGGVGEHPAAGGDPNRFLFCVLPCIPGGQRVDRNRVDVDGSPCVAGLAS